MAPMTGASQWRDAGSLGRTGREDERGNCLLRKSAVGVCGALSEDG